MNDPDQQMKIQPDDSHDKKSKESSGRREEHQRAGDTGSSTNRGPSGAKNRGDASVQTASAYDAIEKAFKQARIRRPEVLAEDDRAPVPLQMAAGYQMAEESMDKNFALLGDGGGVLVPDEPDAGAEQRRPGVERVVPTFATPLESSVSPADLGGAGQVGIDIRPPPPSMLPSPSNDDEPNEAGEVRLEATLVEDQLYDAVQVEANEPEQPIVKAERCISRYILVFCLLVVIGLVIFFIVQYGFGSSSMLCAPIDCQVSTWESYTPCTAKCDGRRNRTREIVVNPDCEGEPCPHVFEEQICNVNCCVDCETTFWSDWSPCSSKCGGGVRTRNRTIVFENDHCGRPCPFLQELEKCNMQECCIDCELSEWSDWSECVEGAQNRTKTIEQAPNSCGKACLPSEEIRDCSANGTGSKDVRGPVEEYLEGKCLSDDDCEGISTCSRDPSCAYHSCVDKQLCGFKSGTCFYVWGAPEAVGERSDQDITVPLRVGSLIAHCSAGTNYTVLVLEDGSAMASGYIELNSYQGHLGLAREAVFQGINGFQYISQVHDGESDGTSRGGRRLLLENAPRFAKVFAGVEHIPGSGIIHTMLLDSNGQVWAMGSNAKGQLCLGDDVDRIVPERVPLAGRIVDVAVGGEHTLVLSDEGVVYGCGSNEAGQLGLGEERIGFGFGPTKLESMRSPVSMISTGHSHSILLANDTGAVYFTGSNSKGQLCADTGGENVYTPTALNTGQRLATSFAAMKESSLLLYEDGAVEGCGRNDFGQVGEGLMADKFIASVGLGGNAVHLLGSGPSAHSGFFATKDGRVFGTGMNGRAQLGVGDDVNRNRPTAVKFDTPLEIDVISSSDVHTVALGTFCTDCQLSEWSAWSSCSAECDGGTQTRTRTIVQAPNSCGEDCPLMEEMRDCNTDNCPDDPTGPGQDPGEDPDDPVCCTDPCQGVLGGAGPFVGGGGVPCQSDANCTKPGQFCSDGHCVSCNDPDTCPDGQYCDSRFGEYLPCDCSCCSDEECEEDGYFCSDNPSCSYCQCVMCDTPDDCPDEDQFCDCRTGTCQDIPCFLGVECCADSLCPPGCASGCPNGLICSTEAHCQFRSCVECTSDSSCKVDQICNCETGTCEEKPCPYDCCVDGDCPPNCPGHSICGDESTGGKICGNMYACGGATHTCIECGADEDCWKFPDRQVCQCSSNTCVQCLNDDQCDIGETCNQGECEEKPCPYDCCVSASCPPNCPGHSICGDESTGGKICGNEYACGGAEHSCIECGADEDCWKFPDRQVCQCSSNTCVQCLNDGHCDIGETCNQGECEEKPCPYVCCVDGNCPPNCPGHSACSAGKICGNIHACGVATHHCVECADDGDCTMWKFADRKVCDCSSNTCVQCLNDGHCDIGETCNQGECEEKPCPYVCCVDGNCPPNCPGHSACSAGKICGNKYACGGATHHCVECGADEDCQEGETCDCSSNRCEEEQCPYVCCVDGPECPPNCPGHSACSGGKICGNKYACGGATHKCVECAEDGDCQDGETCDCSSNRCVEDCECETSRYSSACPDGYRCDGCKCQELSCKYECCDFRGCPSECLEKSCGGGEFCSDNPSCSYRRCVECDTEDDCGSNEYCDCKSGKCRERGLEEGKCWSNSDCKPGEVCKLGRCRKSEPEPECRRSSQCGSDEVCRGGKCEKDDSFKPEPKDPKDPKPPGGGPDPKARKLLALGDKDVGE